jgi:segregation and condensation protein B
VGARTPAEAGQAIAAELRRRRDLLRITQVEAARRTGVARSVINEIEQGHRVPSVRTYERLRVGLGLSLSASALVPRPSPPPVEERQVARLAACLVAAHRAPLSDLAEALDITLPALREGLSVLGERLSPVGMQVLVDGVDAEICPLPFAQEAVGRIVSLEQVRAVTQEQMEVLAIVASMGSATRRQVERLRGEDCESLLRRLTQRGLVEPVPDEARPGGPNIYRLTTRGVAACGHSSLDGLQAELLGALQAADAERWEALRTEPAATGRRSPTDLPAAVAGGN